MDRVELIATAPMGLEAVVAHEVRRLGYEEMAVDNGKVTFRAPAAAIARANLWLRSADRVLLKLGEFTATTFEALFEGTRALPWPEWLPADARFPVEGRSVRSQIASVPACQSIVKKAIVERMRGRYGTAWFPESGPLFAVEVALLKDVATLTIDTSGAGLHKRGYRKAAAPAPLKETLAAALVSLSRWHPDRPLCDPFCGSGTILIEAALQARNAAPGLSRTFAAEAWPFLSGRLWAAARREAREAMLPDRALSIYGSDIDGGVLEVARAAAVAAGLGGQIRFRQLPVARLRLEGEYGFVITNPPYGGRLGEEAEALHLYRDLGKIAAAEPTWAFMVLAAHRGFERAFGRPAARKRKLYNGRIECHYYQYPGPRPPWLKRPEDETQE